MARGQFWDEIRLSVLTFTPLSDEADFWDNENYTFEGILYEDILFNNGTFDGGIWEEYWMGSGIAINDEGAVTAGTLTGFVRWFQFTGETDWYYNIHINSFQISAVAFGAATQSTDPDDDLPVIHQLLSGNDRFWLNYFDDEFYGWTGNDTLRGLAGDDTLSGNAGNDALFGEDDADVLLGGNGRDRLVGGKGRDALTGGADNDTLEGGRNNDSLTGSRGADVFYFDARSATDRITDWEDGIDRIAILKGAETFGDLSISQNGDDALVSFGTVRIIVAGTDAATLSDADFQFL